VAEDSGAGLQTSVGIDEDRAHTGRLREVRRARAGTRPLGRNLIETHHAAAFGVPKSVLPSDHSNLNDGNPAWRAFKRATHGMRDRRDKRDVELRSVIIPSLTCLNDWNDMATTAAAEEIAPHLLC
jgi:hypothetical protein